MNREILYTTAIDKEGNLIHIDNADKGRQYFCPLCKQEFILRKSGKTGKGSRRPHFAHNELSPNCKPETVLHHSFKKKSVELLEKYRIENKPFEIKWSCSACLGQYSGNLLEYAAEIKEEFDLKVCKPDIALIDKNGRVYAVIEVVVTHEPEEIVLKYYEENNIVLIQINLESDEDLKHVPEKLNNPDIIDLCLNRDCTNYDKHSVQRKLRGGTKYCSRCGNSIKRCQVETSHHFGCRITFDFTDEESKKVKSKGINYKIRYRESTKEKYAVFPCERCRRIRSRYKPQPRL